MNPTYFCPKSFSPLSSTFHKLSQIRKITHIASTHEPQYNLVARKYSSDHPPEKPPPEFPAAPQPDKPSESSEVPSAPEFDRISDDGDPTPEIQNPVPDDPYGCGATIAQPKVRQPHGAEVKNPIPPEPDDMVSS
ncbi:hypothetical protein A4A49_26030 [Nicotiana attenuata]|uniref:Uncharacterized protein n=1 Tax=Nicotiana attenuata TaxID=49451 RepID=A0A1J6KCT2_NICAT|nr:hypothetical protein A4A49_26030 [Nicotiana attenuata]